MNNNSNGIDINSIDFEDNPIFARPQDHYFDLENYYIDREDSYLIANLRAENARNPHRNPVASGSGTGSSWNFKKFIIVLAVITILGFLGFGWIFLTALISVVL